MSQEVTTLVMQRLGGITEKGVSPVIVLLDIELGWKEPMEIKYWLLCWVRKGFGFRFPPCTPLVDTLWVSLNILLPCMPSLLWGGWR